jgi:hypothetical protein
LNGTIPAGSECIGIDKLETNKKHFLNAASAAEFEGSFLTGPAERIREIEDRTCQLILANYSLYFFPDILPAIRKALADNGIFIAITHSKNQLQEFFSDLEQIIQFTGSDSSKRIFKPQLQDRFSSENGKEILSQYFSRIKRITYKNQLRFPYQHLSKCIYYLYFKRYTIYDENFLSRSDKKMLNQGLLTYMRKRSKITGSYDLNKDDTIFQCQP